MQKKYYTQLSPGSLHEIPNSKPSEFSGRLILEPRFSGTLILVKKSAWKTIGGFRSEGFLEVDDNFRERLTTHNLGFGIMDGVYVYHWYRADNPYQTSKLMLDKVRRVYSNYIRRNKFDLDKITLLR